MMEIDTEKISDKAEMAATQSPPSVVPYEMFTKDKNAFFVAKNIITFITINVIINLLLLVALLLDLLLDVIFIFFNLIYIF